MTENYKNCIHRIITGICTVCRYSEKEADRCNQKSFIFRFAEKATEIDVVCNCGSGESNDMCKRNDQFCG